MIEIAAQGKTFRQGSKGPWSAPDEWPALENTFTYDFLMDTTEVTQEHFRKLLDRNPVPDASPFGSGDRHAVYNVSWFDAALFCNARSKEAGLDTVYVYSRVDRNSEGSAYNLAGLSIRLERRGVRLPTESEWEYAAGSGLGSFFPWGGLADTGKVSEFAWYSGNSRGKVHPVAGLKANGFGLYDMGGNVMEWVNDWKGAYPALGSANFAGARDPGPEFSTPVKGGAFKYGLRELRPTNRSATYMTIRSATAEYVGFRCVVAGIDHPRFSTSDGNWASTDAVRLEITRLQNLVGGRPAKLVFVNANQSLRHLAYVDFQQTPPRVQEFGDVANVFYPVISPDGNWVAFGTALEGSASGSFVHVRRLGDTASPSLIIGQGFIPRWWVDPATRDTLIIYVNSASDNSLPQWTATRTLSQKMWAGAPIGPPQTLAEGGFHDGLSQDGRWLATGFRLLKIRDGHAGTERTLFTAPENGKAEGDTSQVCNVSIAPDSTGRTLFLDFGYEDKSKLTGSFYDIHQMAFMANPDGKVSRWFKAPREEKGWEDLEWSNHKDFAVSSSTDESGGHRRLYLLNLKDSLFTRLASGTLLSTPGLWLGGAPKDIPVTGLDLDSLGHYDDPATDDNQAVFSSRMALFWKRHSSLELIFTGSSHAHTGIDPRRITRLTALNTGYPANGWLGQDEWVRGYALNHCPRLKVLVMEVFPGWLHHPGGDFTWLRQISRTKGSMYDRTHEYWMDGLPFRFEDLIAQAPNSTKDGADTLGYIRTEPGNWGGAAEIPAESEWGLDNPEYKANMERIAALAADLRERKIHLVLVNYPTNPAYMGNEYYGPYGPRATVAKEILSRLRVMEKASPYLHFYDANDFSQHDYSDSEAINFGHLSSAGAAKLTGRLDSLINTLH